SMCCHSLRTLATHLRPCTVIRVHTLSFSVCRFTPSSGELYCIRCQSQNLALSFGWILLVIAGIARMFLDPALKTYAKDNPAEILFTAPFLLLVFAYNYPVFARASFARFSIPVLPLIFLALSSYIPKDRRLLWALGVLAPILAAASALGIRN